MDLLERKNNKGRQQPEKYGFTRARTTKGDNNRERTTKGDNNRERTTKGENNRERTTKGDNNRERTTKGDNNRERTTRETDLGYLSLKHMNLIFLYKSYIRIYDTYIETVFVFPFLILS
jgi:DUF438 domain-containing protein